MEMLGKDNLNRGDTIDDVENYLHLKCVEKKDRTCGRVIT